MANDDAADYATPHEAAAAGHDVLCAWCGLGSDSELGDVKLTAGADDYYHDSCYFAALAPADDFDESG